MAQDKSFFDRIRDQTAEKVIIEVLGILALGVLGWQRETVAGFLQSHKLPDTIPEYVRAHYVPISLGVMIVLLLGWTGSGIWWRRCQRNATTSHTDEYAELHQRIRHVASGSYTFEREIFDWIDKPKSESNMDRMGRQLISRLLMQMCLLVAKNVNIHDKGATFLVLDRPTQSFRLFQQWGHDFPGLAEEIKKLTTSNSLAGDAIEKQVLVRQEDCSKPDPSIRWHDHHSPTRFRGRVAHPVEIWINNESETKIVGVLCFDMKDPGVLEEVEEQLMATFADKVGMVYAQVEMRRLQTTKPIAKQPPERPQKSPSINRQRPAL